LKYLILKLYNTVYQNITKYNGSTMVVTLIHLIELHAPLCLTFTQVDTVPWGRLWHFWLNSVLCSSV